MARRRDPLHAGLALVAALWVIARVPDPPADAACPRPGELRAEAGWTVWVACDTEKPSPPLRGAAPLLLGCPLDLNQAGPRALEVLPGIGPARAARIVRERARAPFDSLADLARVHGIGAGIVAGLAGWAEARPGRTYESQKCFQLVPNP